MRKTVESFSPKEPCTEISSTMKASSRDEAAKLVSLDFSISYDSNMWGPSDLPLSTVIKNIDNNMSQGYMNNGFVESSFT